MLITCFSYVILNFVDWITVIIALTLLMRIVMSFVWRKFSSVGREEWCNKIKDGQELKLGDAPVVTPRNIQEVQASKLGDAQGIPSSSAKSTRSFFNALYFYCFMQYVLFLERLYFLSCVLFFNKVGPHHPFVLERDTLHLFSSLIFPVYYLWELFQISWLVLEVEKNLRVFRDANGSLFRLCHRL